MRWGRADKGIWEGMHTGRHKYYQLISAGKEADIWGPPAPPDQNWSRECRGIAVLDSELSHSFCEDQEGGPHLWRPQKPWCRSGCRLQALEDHQALGEWALWPELNLFVPVLHLNIMWHLWFHLCVWLVMWDIISSKLAKNVKHKALCP